MAEHKDDELPVIDLAKTEGDVVDDSDPQKEWEETMNKGRALFRAVAEAAKGL